MERLVKVVKDLRQVYRFNGYIHLKSIPRGQPRTGKRGWFIRGSYECKLEIPNEQSLQLLAPEKDFQSVFTPMRYIQQGMLQSAEERKKYRHAPRFVPAGQSTQMIVGATSDSDKDILHLTSALYKRPSMKRVYYSGFVPVNGYDQPSAGLEATTSCKRKPIVSSRLVTPILQFQSR